MHTHQKYYVIAIILASIASLLYLYPHAYLTYKHGFTGYDRAIQTDEEIYSVLVVKPHHDPYIWEKRDNPGPWERLPVKILALFERLIDMENTFLLWDFLGPFLYIITFWAMLLYSLDDRSGITKDKNLMILISIISSCILWSSLVTFGEIINPLLAHIYHGRPIIVRPNWWTSNVVGGVPPRVPFPGVDFPFLLIFIAGLVKYFRSQEFRITYSLILGGLLSISLYMRFFDYIIISGIFGFLALIYLSYLPTVDRMMKRVQSSKSRIILLGIAGSLLFFPAYIGIFYRLTPDYLKQLGFLAAGGVVLFLFISQQRFYYPRKQDALKHLVLVMTAFLLVSLPRIILLASYWLSSSGFMEPNVTGNQNVSFFQKHLPNVHSLRYMFFLLIVWFVSEKLARNFRKRKLVGEIFQIPLLICVGATFGRNLQMILGKNIDPIHYLWLYLNPMNTFIVSFVILLIIYVKLRARYILITFFILCLLAGFITQAAWMRHIEGGGSFRVPSYQKDQTQAQIYRWISENTDENSVIASNYFSATIVRYTKRFSFLPHLHHSPSMTLDEFCERYLLLQGMLGYSFDTLFSESDAPILGYFRQNLIKSSYKHYLEWPLAHRQWGSLSQSFKKLESFRGHPQSWFLQKTLSRYKIDYVVITPLDIEQIPEGKLIFFAKSPYFKEVFRSGDAHVYQIESLESHESLF